jgi:signal transduction histidine kinase
VSELDDWTFLARDLAVRVRHDLRDPLSAITHWLELLVTPGLDPVLRDRAMQGIRAGLDEQLVQIARLAGLLDHVDPTVLRVRSNTRDGQQPLDLKVVLDQVLDSLAPVLRARVRRGPPGPPEQALMTGDLSGLVLALSAITMHGLKQLLADEHMQVNLDAETSAGWCRFALQVCPATDPVDRPWRALTDPGETPDLALLHARSVLSLHRVGLRIATTVCSDDTALLDFPLDGCTDEPCSDR